MLLALHKARVMKEVARVLLWHFVMPFV